MHFYEMHQSVNQIPPTRLIYLNNEIVFLNDIMKVFVDKKPIQLEENTSVFDLLEKLNINPETVVVKKNNEIVHENEELKENDKIEILDIVSGG